MGDYQDEIGATREKPMEQTAGQRIAAEFARPESHRELVVCAAAIDEAIAAAREEEADRWREREAAVCPEDVGFPEFVQSLQKQLAAKEAESAAMRSALTQLLPYFKSLSQFERESKALHDAWNAAIIRTAGTDQSDTAPDAVMAGFIEQAIASNSGEALLARLRAAEKARDEHIAYIQHVLNPQLEAAADAIADVMALIGGSDEWDGVPATGKYVEWLEARLLELLAGEPRDEEETTP